MANIMNNVDKLFILRLNGERYQTRATHLCNLLNIAHPIVVSPASSFRFSLSKVLMAFIASVRYVIHEQFHNLIYRVV